MKTRNTSYFSLSFLHAAAIIWTWDEISWKKRPALEFEHKFVVTIHNQIELRIRLLLTETIFDVEINFKAVNVEHGLQLKHRR